MVYHKHVESDLAEDKSKDNYDLWDSVIEPIEPT